MMRIGGVGGSCVCVGGMNAILSLRVGLIFFFDGAFVYIDG